MNKERRFAFVCAIAIQLCINLLYAQFTVNGKPVVYNATDSIYMCAIPDTIFGSDYVAQIEIEGRSAVDDSMVFADVRGGKIYDLHAYLDNGDSLVCGITFTNLPLVVLEGEFGYDYAEGNVHLYHPDSVGGMNNMSAKIKWRGGTTNAASKHKRNYTLKFLNEKGKKQKRQFFGLRNSNTWILNAGQVDLARCRNLIGHELWQDMCRKPYYIAQAPDALTNVRGQFVEVLLNNEYRGLYSLTENVDQEQMGLMKYDEEQSVIHGQLWKTDSWDGTTMKDLAAYDNGQERYRGYETKYPDFDDVNPTDYSLLYKAIAFVVNSTDQEFEQHVEKFFDVPVLIDYYLFLDVLVARDNNGKNMFWGCYDKQSDKRLTVGVWDLDCTIGQNYTDTDPHPDSFGPEVDVRSQQMRLTARLLKIPYYSNLVCERYWELSKTCLNADSLTARYEKYFSLFERGGAASREEKRWSGDSDIAGLSLSFQEEFEFMADWIRKRFAYLNSKEFNTNNPTTGFEKSSDIGSDEQLYTLLGVPVDKPMGGGIYLQRGRKILVVQ